MHIHNVPFFFGMKITGALKGLVLGPIQLRLRYLHNYF